MSAELEQAVAIARVTAQSLKNFYSGVEMSLAGMLESPPFLFRLEVAEPDPDRRGSYRLDAYSRASQLSFFLWNSGPDEALTEAARSELGYWQSQPWSASGRVPLDYPDGSNTVASMQRVTSALSAAETDALLREVPGVYHTQINDVLLAALGRVLGSWMKASQVLINLEGHGRESLVEAVDVSRTVGWFTSVFPVQLSAGADEGWGEHLQQTKERLRRIPHRGVGYGVLRYLSGLQSECLDLAPQISCNYLGKLNDEVSEGALFGLAPEEEGGWPMSPQGMRAHLIDVTAIVWNGSLQVSWWYSANVHRPETLAGLAKAYIEALQALISHCQLSKGGFTLSDFPLILSAL